MSMLTNRREFFTKSLGLLGATGVLASSSAAMQQEKVTTGMHSSGRFEDTMIFERKPFSWPGGKSIAVWVVPNVEIWSFDSAADAAITPDGAAGPDVINYATREYGLRIG